MNIYFLKELFSSFYGISFSFSNTWLGQENTGGGDCEVFSGVICKIANLQENIYACYLKYIYFYSSLLLTIYYIEE